MRRSSLLVLLLLIALALVASPAFAAKKGKKKKGAAEEPPPVGKVMVGKFACYAPPDFAKIEGSAILTARSEALEFVMGTAYGTVNEGFKIEDDEAISYLETAFYGRPALLDEWLPENFKRCKAVGEGKMKASEYLAWLAKQGEELEAGECYKPLDYEYHNFMDIQVGWQYRIHVCKDDQALIETTGLDNGKYTIQDTGKWKENVYITADGMPVAAGKYDKMDPLPPEAVAQPAGDKGPVAEEPHGAVVMRFEAEDGSYTKYFLVGAKLEFQAPDHGFISFTVNDTTFFDNKFHDVRGAIDYLGLDIYPPVEE
jgi:hypothetical protein